MKFALLLLLALTAAAQASLKDATWRVRDVAASGTAENLRLDPQVGESETSCTVTDTSGKDRAVTLSLCLPIDAIGGTWWDDPQRSRAQERIRKVFHRAVPTRCPAAL